MAAQQPDARRVAENHNTPSLVYRLRQSRMDRKAPLLILLHGYGSNEEDLLGLAPYLDERFTIVSARAPYTLGPGSYAWYAVEFRSGGIAIDPAQAEASRKTLTRFIVDITATSGVDFNRVYLMGFSQGAAMTGSVLVTRPDLLAGAVMMSGHVPPVEDGAQAAPDRLKDKPALIVHGAFDELLPVEEGRASRNLLQSLGLSVTYREYPMAHQVTDESLEDVDRWLVERIIDAASG
jgi:phospholipase/carboxylesterase